MTFSYEHQVELYKPKLMVLRVVMMIDNLAAGTDEAGSFIYTFEQDVEILGYHCTIYKKGASTNGQVGGAFQDPGAKPKLGVANMAWFEGGIRKAVYRYAFPTPILYEADDKMEFEIYAQNADGSNAVDNAHMTWHILCRRKKA